MSGESTYVPKSRLAKWLESRLPVGGLIHSSFVVFPNPRNLNYWWTFGGILSFMLAAQIVTGVVLAMHYTPQSSLAFASIEHIMRDVNSGWLLRYAHANGASMFFLALYIHMFRGMYYGSYKAPREVLWLLGVILFLLAIATAFTGYVLPWGQMSLGGDGHHQPVLGHSVGWRFDYDLAVGRIRGRQRDPQSFFLASLSAAVPNRGRRRLAYLGAACSWIEQSGRGRKKDRQGHLAFPSLFHCEGRFRACLLPCVFCMVCVLRAELSFQCR